MDHIELPSVDHHQQQSFDGVQDYGHGHYHHSDDPSPPVEAIPSSNLSDQVSNAITSSNVHSSSFSQEMDFSTPGNYYVEISPSDVMVDGVFVADPYGYVDTTLNWFSDPFSSLDQAFQIGHQDIGQTTLSPTEAVSGNSEITWPYGINWEAACIGR